MSVRPRYFIYGKNPQNLGETWPPVPVFISKASDPLLLPTARAVTVGWLRIAIQRRRCVCVWQVCRRSRGCVRTRVRACAVRAYVREVFAIYDNTI